MLGPNEALMSLHPEPRGHMKESLRGLWEPEDEEECGGCSLLDMTRARDIAHEHTAHVLRGVGLEGGARVLWQ